MTMQTISRSTYLITFSLLAVAAITTSFQDSSKNNLQQRSTIIQDTIPKSHVKVEVDLDDALQKMDIELNQVNITLKQIEWDKISKELQNSLKDININVQKNIIAALDKVDMQKIKNEIERSVKAINMAQINDQIKSELEAVKLKLNSDEFRKNLEEIKKINSKELQEELRKAQIEIDRNKIDIKLQLEKAAEQVKNAKVQVTQYKELVSEMKKDGLIKDDEGYDIKMKGNEHYINGKKQTCEITNT